MFRDTRRGRCGAHSDLVRGNVRFGWACRGTRGTVRRGWRIGESIQERGRLPILAHTRSAERSATPGRQPEVRRSSDERAIGASQDAWAYGLPPERI